MHDARWELPRISVPHTSVKEQKESDERDRQPAQYLLTAAWLGHAAWNLASL
jgi:hypothetical protein